MCYRWRAAGHGILQRQHGSDSLAWSSRIGLSLGIREAEDRLSEKKAVEKAALTAGGITGLRTERYIYPKSDSTCLTLSTLPARKIN